MGSRIADHIFVDGVESKWCSVCKIYHPLGYFSMRKQSEDGLQGHCRNAQGVVNDGRKGTQKVYAMVSADRVKIGRTTATRKGLISRYKMHNAYPVRLTLLTHCADKKQAIELEHQLHMILKHRRTHGEWFHIGYANLCVNPFEEYHTTAYRRKYGDSDPK